MHYWLRKSEYFGTESVGIEISVPNGSPSYNRMKYKDGVKMREKEDESYMSPFKIHQIFLRKPMFVSKVLVVGSIKWYLTQQP